MVKTQMFPFVYRESSFPRYTKKSGIKPIINIRAMFEQHFLDEIDTAILLHLQKYVYLNAFLIRTLLSRELEKCTPEYCSLRLKNLEKLGFVVKFQFVYTDDKMVEHSTPFVYNLSVSGRKLFPITEDKSFNDNIMDIDCVQRRLAYNQFHIMLENQYHHALEYSSYAFGRQYDGLYKLKTNTSPVIFYVISIRSSNEWAKGYLNRLRNLKLHIESAGLSYSGIIVVCENEMQSLKAEKSRSGDKELGNLDVYYVADRASVAEGCILHHVIHVKPESNYANYDIVRINVEGEIKENVIEKGE